MAVTVTKGLIGLEDLSRGTGTFTRTTSTGGTATLNQIPFSATLVNVQDYDATGDGTTDDTAFIQAAIAASNPGDIIYFPGTANSYRITAALSVDGISDRIFMGGGTITNDGTGADGALVYAFDLANTCDNIQFWGLNIIGTESAALDDAVKFQGGIGFLSGQTVTNCKVIGCTFENLNIGVTWNANLSGTASDNVVAFSRFKNIIGGGGAADNSGQGYGFHAAGDRNKVISCHFDTCGRHAIYFAKGTGGIARDCTVVNHRTVRVTTSQVLRPAIVVQRSTGVLIDGCRVTDFWDAAIGVSKDADTTDHCRDVSVVNCYVSGNLGSSVPYCYVGQQSTDITYVTENILFANNTFDMDGADAGLAEAIRIYNGINVTFERNEIRAHGYSSGTKELMRLGFPSYTLAGNTANVVVRHNQASLTNYAGATIRGIRFDNCVLITTTMDFIVEGNTYYDDATGTFTREYFAATNANGSLRYHDPFRAIPTVASTAALTLLSYTDVQFISGTADITSIAACYAGRQVTLIFTGTYGTTGVVDGSNLKLRGDFPYIPDSALTLVCDGTNWYEVARSRISTVG